MLEFRMRVVGPDSKAPLIEFVAPVTPLPGERHRINVSMSGVTVTAPGRLEVVIHSRKPKGRWRRDASLPIVVKAQSE